MLPLVYEGVTSWDTQIPLIPLDGTGSSLGSGGNDVQQLYLLQLRLRLDAVPPLFVILGVVVRVHVHLHFPTSRKGSTCLAACAAFPVLQQGATDGGR